MGSVLDPARAAGSAAGRRGFQAGGGHGRRQPDHDADRCPQSGGWRLYLSCARQHHRVLRRDRGSVRAQHRRGAAQLYCAGHGGERVANHPGVRGAFRLHPGRDQRGRNQYGRARHPWRHCGELWARDGWLYGDTNHDGVADPAIHVAGKFSCADILFQAHHTAHSSDCFPPSLELPGAPNVAPNAARRGAWNTER